MASLAHLGIESFRQVEIDFLSACPQAMEEDKSLANFIGLNPSELKSSMEIKLNKIFHSRPKDLSDELRSFMADVYYHFVTIKEEKSEKIQGFVTFMSGGSAPKNEYKITILAVDKNVRRTGLASLLINSLNKIGVKYRKIFASTCPTNAIAINAYKKWGFVEDQEILKNTHSYFVKGHWVHLARFE